MPSLRLYVALHPRPAPAWSLSKWLRSREVAYLALLRKWIGK